MPDSARQEGSATTYGLINRRARFPAPWRADKNPGGVPEAIGHSCFDALTGCCRIYFVDRVAAADSRAWMCRKSVGRFHGSRRSASNCVTDEKNAHGKQNRDRAVAPIGDEHPIIDGAAGQRLPRCLIFSSPGWGVAQLLENIISTATATRFVPVRSPSSRWSRGSRRPTDPSFGSVPQIRPV
jgi:hypothetical protein